MFRAAQQNVRLNADSSQFFHAMLRRFGFQFLRRRNPGHQRHMHKNAILTALLMPHLPDSFQERQRFDIAHRTANFHDHYVHIFRNLLDTRLDFVGYMRNHLHRLAQIIAAPLALNDRFVNTPTGQVIRLR